MEGVIAHMGICWLGLVALGSCDLWLFFVMLLHTVAENRDHKRAIPLTHIQHGAVNVANVISKREGSLSRLEKRYDRPLFTDDSTSYSPDASNYYKPSPYEDDCDFGFRTIPFSQKQSMRHRPEENTFANSRYIKNTTAKTPVGRSTRQMLVEESESPNSENLPDSPLYIPHYDDEAIGGRAFY